MAGGGGGIGWRDASGRAGRVRADRTGGMRMRDSWGGALPLRREDGQIMVGTDDLVPP